MSTGTTSQIAAWKLFPIVAAIPVSIVGGFYLGGPGLGMAVGALAAGTIIVMAIRKPPAHPIEPPLPMEFRRHVLIVLAAQIDEPAGLESLLFHLGPEATAPRIQLVALARHGRLARWTSDLEPGHERARQALVLGLALLAKAGFAASARVSDDGVVQCVDDELRTFPATDVVLFAAPDQDMGVAVDELDSRLTVPLRRVARPAGPPPSQRSDADWPTVLV